MGNYTFKQAADAWLQTIFKGHADKPNYLKGCKSVRKHLSYFDDMSITEVDAYKVSDYLDTRKVGKTTLKLDVTHIVMILNFATEIIDPETRKPYLPAVPKIARHTLLKKRIALDKGKRPKSLTDENVNALLSTLEKSEWVALRPVVALCLYAGLRIDEAKYLTWGDFDGHEITVQPKGSWSPKNGQTRYIHAVPALVLALSKWRDECVRGGRKLTAGDWICTPAAYKTGQWSNRLGDKLRELWLAAGIYQRGNPIAHALRHTFAIRKCEAGEPITTVRDELGHGSLVITDRYARAARKVKA